MMLECKVLRILRIHETKRYQKKFKNKTKQTLTFILPLFKSSESEFQSTQFSGGGERRVGRGPVEYGGGLLFYFLIFLCYRYHYYFWMLCYKVSLVII